MKIGLISDIHGDIDALRMALEHLHDADHILCAGDLVEKGSAGPAVVDLIRERSIPTVRGNHDEMIQGNQQWLIENTNITSDRLDRKSVV
jgi:predicted phosphodiesterase